MVDRGARDIAAQLLRNFISGKISNDAFEDNRPRSLDRAIDAIWETAWIFYTDSYEHRLVGEHKLTTDMRRVCVRWILFLQSNHEYEWPDIDLPGIDPSIRTDRTKWSLWKRMFSSDSRPQSAIVTKFLAAGHYPVWPFVSSKDYRIALTTPRFMSGKSRH